MVIWAFFRDVVARACQLAPVGAGVKSRAETTSVGRGTTTGDFNAGIRRNAPGLSLRADTLASRAVVLAELGTIHREIVASVESSTPASASYEAQTVTAKVMGVAAARNPRALEGARAKSEAGLAHTISAAIVVARAFSRYDSASVLGNTPASSEYESHAVATTIAGCAAGRDFDTGRLESAPAVVGRTDAVSAAVVVARTFQGDDRALVGKGTPGVS